MAGITPMPKTKAFLQRGRKPRETNQFEDPDDAIRKVPIIRTVMNDRAGAVPSEAYQYDLVYECFAMDEEFQRYWKVPKNGFARCSTEESISQKNSYIRVVMDLDKGCKLYPTAYTPGFTTVPRDISDNDLAKANASSESQPRISGLPEGYSVALDVYILKDAQILLKHQRAFRGRVDANYRWLDAIVNPGVAAEELEGGELAMLEVTPSDNTIMHPDRTDGGSGQSQLKLWNWHSVHGQSDKVPSSSVNPKALQSLHEVFQPIARDNLPLSCLAACPRGLKADPNMNDSAKRMQDFRKEVHTENALINAFGSHVGLPQRDSGISLDGGYTASRRRADEEETRLLDKKLEDLWTRTVSDSNAREEQITEVSL